MPDYKKMYFQLSAKVADAVDILVKAQRQGEKDYMEEEFPVFSLTQTDPLKPRAKEVCTDTKSLKET